MTTVIPKSKKHLMMISLNQNMNVPNVKIKIKSFGEHPKFLNFI
jgi:hypothetical protein